LQHRPGNQSGRLTSGLRGILATTPGRLKLGFTVITLTSLCYLGISSGVISGTNQAIQTIGFDAVPSIVAAEEIRAQLADMDANAGNVFLADETDSQHAWQSFLAEEKNVADKLVLASQNITYTEEKDALDTLTEGLEDYQRLLGEARAEGHQAGVPALGKASDLLRSTLLPAAVKLDDANFRALDTEYKAYWSSVIVKLIAFGATSLTMLAALLVVQLGLTRSTRRLFNIPMAIATMIAVAAIAWQAYGLLTAAEEMRAAKQDSFDSIHALWKTRATAYDANSDETYYLLVGDRRDQDRYQAAFFSNADLILDAAGPEIERQLRDFGDAGSVPEILRTGSRDFSLDDYVGMPPFVQKDPVSFKGYLGDELRNITYRGEGQAAIATTLLWAQYRSIDRDIRSLAQSGQHAQAVALNIGTAPGQSNWMFQRFDTALGILIQINSEEFRSQVESAVSAMKGQIWGVPATAILVIVLTWLGLQPRLNEYKD